MKLSQILTLAMFVVVLVGAGFGVYLKANGTVTWSQFAAWEASSLALLAIIGRVVWYDLQRKS